MSDTHRMRSTRTLAVLVRPGGGIEMVHDEGLGLDDLGTCAHRRASTVEYDERAQAWKAMDVETGTLIHQDPKRSACLRAEREYFHRRFREGFRPFPAPRTSAENCPGRERSLQATNTERPARTASPAPGASPEPGT